MKARLWALAGVISVWSGCKDPRTPLAPIVAQPPVAGPSVAPSPVPVPTEPPPVALTCRAEPRAGPAPLKVKFRAHPTGGTGTYDFEWRFGDGATSNQVHPSHTYVSAGLFTASVRVTSGSQGASCERSITTADSRAPAPGPGPGPSPRPTPPPFQDLVITILGQNGNLSYSPNPAAARVGQRVVWKNADPGMTHTATAAGGAFNTGFLGSGASSAPIPMGAEGNFPYFCGLHPSMTGTLTVTR